MAEAVARVIAPEVVKMIPCCFEIIEKILEAMKIAKENDERCNHICGQVSVVKRILGELERMSQTAAVIEAVSFLHQKLTVWDKYMNEMFDRKFSRARDFVEGRKNGRVLMRLSREIDSAVLTLTAAVTTQHAAQQQGIYPTSAPANQKITGSIPGRPKQISVTKRAQDRIKLSWSQPDKNAEAVSHYEVQYRKRWQTWEVYKCAKITKTDVVVAGLSSDTKYWFRVRAVNSMDYEGWFSEEIPTETKFRPAVRRLLTAGAAVGGTLVTPIAYPAGVVMGTVEAIKEHKGGEAAFIATAGVIATPFSAPLTGAASAYALHTVLAPDDFDDEDN